MTQSPQSLPGMNVLLMGPINSGKTTALTTLLDCGLEVFGIFTEPGMEVLPLDAAIKWAYCKPQAPSIDVLEQQAELVQRMNYDDLLKVKNQNRSEFNQFLHLLQLTAKFTDDRTGEVFGDVTQWNTDRVFFLDGLSGLSKLITQHILGTRPQLTMPEVGLAQGMIQNYLDVLIGSRCHFILTSHIDLEPEPITGQRLIMVDTIGNKLAPRIPKDFSDVILTSREKGKFLWNNDEPMAKTKARNLPFGTSHEPDFRPMIAKWQSRGGLIQPTTEE